MHAKHSHWLYEIFIFKTLCHHFQPELITPVQRGFVLNFFCIPLWPPVANWLIPLVHDCQFFTSQNWKEKKKSWERERERKKQCNFHLVPHFEECSRSVTYYEQAKYVSVSSFFWEIHKIFPILTDDPLNLPIKRRGGARSLHYDDEPPLVLVIASVWRPGCLASALALLLWERERDTHTHTCHLLWPLADAKKAHHSIAELSFVEVCVTGRVCFLGVLSCI
jgi:hypothetical protein